MAQNSTPTAPRWSPPPICWFDQQTVKGSGGTVKVSSSSTQTWSNGSGQYYPTNDPNANPTGVLSGNWTQQKKVHGDGTPY